ncbi:Tetraspanin family [Popillia japonica]|uniref:Tetraspanin family n=1 Tax=Popillia japonica TaxID=7064 RepID=A0AAW1JFN0_POPJA
MPFKRVLAFILFIVFNSLLTLMALADFILPFIRSASETKLVDMPSAKAFHVGPIVFSTAFLVLAGFGWLAFVTRSRLLLIIYAVILLVLGVAMLIISLVIYVIREPLMENGRDALTAKLMLSYYEYPDNEKRQKEVDDMQQSYKCCGPDRPANITETTYLPSCCATLDKGQCLKPYEQTCVDAILNYAKSVVTTVSTLAFVLSLVLFPTGGATVMMIVTSTSVD